MPRKKNNWPQNTALKTWFDAQPYAERENLRKLILQATMANNSKWGNWMSHKSRITPLEQKAIEKELNAKIF